MPRCVNAVSDLFAYDQSIGWPCTYMHTGVEHGAMHKEDMQVISQLMAQRGIFGL
jgi:hypothetical protein